MIVDNKLLLTQLFTFFSSVDWKAVPGFRARFLPSVFQEARSYYSVVLFCGNNDLTAHPTKTWLRPELPETVAQNYIQFAEKLRLRGTKVFIVALLLRPDNSSQDVQTVNRILRENNASFTYISSRDIRDNLHFRTDDPVHLNMDLGVYHAKRLFARLIKNILCYGFSTNQVINRTLG